MARWERQPQSPPPPPRGCQSLASWRGLLLALALLAAFTPFLVSLGVAPVPVPPAALPAIVKPLEKEEEEEMDALQAADTWRPTSLAKDPLWNSECPAGQSLSTSHDSVSTAALSASCWCCLGLCLDIIVQLRSSNGYLTVRCNGGLNQQRTAICNAVVVARLMNATLVLPLLDSNEYWNDKSGFKGIYDVDHFIKYLRNDVTIVQHLPKEKQRGKGRRLRPMQMRPPRDAPPSWYLTGALESMRKHGAIYLTPFSHRLAEELPQTLEEYQRLRCRVNFHALRFSREVVEAASTIVKHLRSQGQFLAIHLRFEMDMLAFAGCIDIFTPRQQQLLWAYRLKNFANKTLVYEQRRKLGKCPLTPEEARGSLSSQDAHVGSVLQAMGFKSETRIYLASGDIFAGEVFLQPLRAMFPRLVNRTAILGLESQKAEGPSQQGLLGPAIDYLVCLEADVFMPTYDGPSNFANNVIGHRLYSGFRSTIQPDRKALAPVFVARERRRFNNSQFLQALQAVMHPRVQSGPHQRKAGESFYTNPWPECFCKEFVSIKMQDTAKLERVEAMQLCSDART
eukprot:SM000302S11661  [mRNA]  locus=s302:15685:18996:+ [translate_table: standard]